MRSQYGPWPALYRAQTPLPGPELPPRWIWAFGMPGMPRTAVHLDLPLLVRRSTTSTKGASKAYLLNRVLRRRPDGILHIVLGTDRRTRTKEDGKVVIWPSPMDAAIAAETAWYVRRGPSRLSLKGSP